MNGQLMPEPFIRDLVAMANAMGGFPRRRQNKVSRIRGGIYIAKAMVTKAHSALLIDGKTVYRSGFPIHQG